MTSGQVVILVVTVEHHFEVFVVMDELWTQPSLEDFCFIRITQLMSSD